MKRFLFLTGVWAFALAFGLVSVAASAAVSPTATTKVKFTATQIVAKNVAARGGLKAWRAVNTLTLAGRMEAGGQPALHLASTD